MICKLHFDGGFASSTVSYGYVISDENNNILDKGGDKFLEKGSTNIVAEYMALVTGLTRCLKLGATKVRVYGDSQTAIYQLNGTYKVRDTNARPLYYVTKGLIKQFDHVELNWIPREQNREADREAKI